MTTANETPDANGLPDTGGELDLGALSGEVLAAAGMSMPFGRFEGRRLIDLPEPYVVWFKQQGFPPGLLGQRLALVYELKANGLEKLVRPLLASHSPARNTPDA